MNLIMGLCGSKSGNTGEAGLMDKVKNMAFSMIVKSGGGDQNNSQFDMLKNLVMSKFPNANIK